MDFRDEARFVDAIAPLVRQDFFKKRVLDAACGLGRNSFWTVRWGAREVVAFDQDPVLLEHANRLLKRFSNVTVVQGDLYEKEWDRSFQVVFAIDVLEHLPDAAAAIESLAKPLSPHGIFLIRVPQRERRGILGLLLGMFRLSDKRYFTEEDARALFPEETFAEVHTFPSNKNRRWTVIGLKK